MSTEAHLTTLEHALATLATFQAQATANLDRQTASLERLFEEMRASDRQRGKQWGELANKMGTLVEDIVAPGIPEIFRRCFGLSDEVEMIVRVTRSRPGRSQEFDVVATAGDFVLINETRSRLVPRDVSDFPVMLARAREFLPEAQGKRVVGSLASFYVDPALVKAGQRRGLLMVGLGDGLLDILNTPDFRPREF